MKRLTDAETEVLGIRIFPDNTHSTRLLRIKLCKRCKEFGGTFTFAKKDSYRCWHDACDHPAVYKGEPNVCENFERD